MVAIFTDGIFSCGGVIITNRWVVTAAHCVSMYWEHYYEVHVGMLRRLSYSPQVQNHRVTHVVVNQQYNRAEMSNDLSLLRVAPAIQFSRWVRPVCLPSPSTAGSDWMWGPSPGTMCTAVGWGSTTEHGPDPDHMREVEVPIWEKCKNRADIAGREICAGYYEGGKDACQGDSGGPLLCKNPRNHYQWYMAGIVSHGDGCGRQGEPGVYTRISLFVGWIHYNLASQHLPSIKPKQDCPGFRCISGTTKCFPIDKKCDKIVNCLDGEDEINCQLFRSNAKKIVNSTEITNNKEYETSSFRNIDSQNFQTPKTGSNEIQNEQKYSTEEETTRRSHSSRISDDISDLILTKSKLNNSLSLNVTAKDNNQKKISTIELRNQQGQQGDVISNTLKEFVQNSTENYFGSNTIYNDFRQNKSNEITNAEKVNNTFENKSTIYSMTTPDYLTKFVSVTDNSLTTVTMENTDIKRTTINNNLNILSTTTDDFYDSDNFFNSPESKFYTKESGRVVTNPHPIETTTITVTTESSYTTFTSHSPKNSTLKPLQEEKGIDIEITQAILIRKPETRIFFTCAVIPQILPISKYCNRFPDCEDGTDEIGCGCLELLTTFSPEKICDGVVNCINAPDEDKCFSCSPGKFLCKKSRQCIPNQFVCDGKQHCDRGEDESDCVALTNGKLINLNEYGESELRFEGFLTTRHSGLEWHVDCRHDIDLKSQENAASNVCTGLGFSGFLNIKIRHISTEKFTRKTRNLNDNALERWQDIKYYQHINVNGTDFTERKLFMENAEAVPSACEFNLNNTCGALYVICTPVMDKNLVAFQIIEPQYRVSADGKIEDSEISQRQSEYAWPWAAKVYVEGQYKCTGVLINLSWVLINHGCLWDSLVPKDYVSVVLGSTQSNLTVQDPFEQIIEVDTKKDIMNLQVTLLHLKKPAHWSRMVKPMVSPSLSVQRGESEACVTVGRGQDNRTQTVILKEIHSDCEPQNKCFIRQGPSSICIREKHLKEKWAGLIVCKGVDGGGWYPAASYTELEGECGFQGHVKAISLTNSDANYRNIIANNAVKIIPDFTSACAGVRCDEGRCIPLNRTCDHVSDCIDGQDEQSEACGKKQRFCSLHKFSRECACKAGEMKCINGLCISKSKFKDGVDDCGDGSDEPPGAACAQYLALAYPNRLCDGKLHCKDRSDELPSSCKCFSKRTFKCQRSNTCVAQDMVCDGINDCPHGEDESSCTGLGAFEGIANGAGKVLQRRFGVWHSKCFTKPRHTKNELEQICKDLGFVGGHARQLKIKVSSLNPNTRININQFVNMQLNNVTTLTLRNNDKPLARAIRINETNTCYSLFIECK